MRELLLNPKFIDLESTTEFLIRLGVKIKKPKIGTTHAVAIRRTTTQTIYSFQLLCDSENFINFLTEYDISFNTTDNVGVIFAYAVGIFIDEPITKKPLSTSYTIDSVNKAVELIKELKNITARSQDYENSAILRDMERYYLDKLEKDSKRTL